MKSKFFIPLLLGLLTLITSTPTLKAEVAATHIYHNHMPNFWPYYDVTRYHQTPDGAPIRYTYDGQVVNLKNSPPANYTFYLPNGNPMPHDHLTGSQYYGHHAKRGAYLSWPMNTAGMDRDRHPFSQTHVTMSASVINNVNSFAELGNMAGFGNLNWGEYWRNTYSNVKTVNNKRSLDMIHFTGHHTLGPLVGDEYFLKELIYHNVTLAQNFFLGNTFESSKGFFPTELGFSERLIPSLKKLGVEWSVLPNVQLSRTLRDYPYLNDPGKDTMISPPNRADLQNVDPYNGKWVDLKMVNEQQVTYNKFPFASIPHWVQYVDPETGQADKIAGIPVEQASSWEEGYLCRVTGGFLNQFLGYTGNRTQYFVIAHDGDNSSGCAGDGGTWANSKRVTYSEDGVIGMGVEEYLKAYPIPSNDIVHVQNGSWIDTRDSSADPTWYHWRLPMGIWKGQFYDFNRVNGTNFSPLKNYQGLDSGMTVSFEYGYHYLERNYAMLQAALNYAKTAEQIWLDDHPDHWRPKTRLDHEITHPGNQLNPWMMSYPIKGKANPAELAWYFLLPAIDSGFGYYDENQDDHVKPTISFNQSLYFSVPYVARSLRRDSSKDKTGPSLWIPQRFPYNPGSANKSKAMGWTTHYFDNTFAIYTYAFDLNGIKDIKLKIRVHREKRVNPIDRTCRVYDPQKLAARGVPHIDPERVGKWKSYSMRMRDLTKDINGVEWQKSVTEVIKIVPAQKIGNLYFTYLNQYRDQLLDYYIEAVDQLGNVTKTPIQRVYVGTGKFTQRGGKIVEDPNGKMKGTFPFVTAGVIPGQEINVGLFIKNAKVGTVEFKTISSRVSEQGSDKWTPAHKTTYSQCFPQYLEGNFRFSVKENVRGIMIRYRDREDNVFKTAKLRVLASTTWVIDGNKISNDMPVCKENCWATVYYKTSFKTPFIHYRPQEGSWTPVPGVPMENTSANDYYKFTVQLGTANKLEAVFNDGKGTWDNNGGHNYIFPVCNSTLKNGKISIGVPD